MPGFPPTGFPESISYHVNMSKATRKPWSCCLFGFQVFLLQSSEFLKGIVNVVNVISCTCDDPRNVLK